MLRNILLVGIVLILLGESLAQDERELFCLGKKGKFADPRGDCRSYYVCSIIFGFKYTCPNQWHFSSTFQMCMEPSRAGCEKTLSAKETCNREKNYKNCLKTPSCDFCYDEVFRGPRCDILPSNQCKYRASQIRKNTQHIIKWEISKVYGTASRSEIVLIAGDSQPINMILEITQSKKGIKEIAMPIPPIFNQCPEFFSTLMSALFQMMPPGKNELGHPFGIKDSSDLKLGLAFENPRIPANFKIRGNSCGSGTDICGNFDELARFHIELRSEPYCSNNRGFKIIGSVLKMTLTKGGEKLQPEYVEVTVICPDKYLEFQ